MHLGPGPSSATVIDGSVETKPLPPLRGRSGGGSDGSQGDARRGDIAAFPDNWRELIAQGDGETLKMLTRFSAPQMLVKSWREAQSKISAGVRRTPMPDGSDAAALKEWRKAEGIPDEPSGYRLDEAITRRMTDEDKPLIAAFTEFAHKKGARPEAVTMAAEWYFDTVEAMEAQRGEADRGAAAEAEEFLRAEWGADYRGNLTLAARFVATIPGVGPAWSEARMADGRRLGDTPAFMAWAAEQGRLAFGDTTFAGSERPGAAMSRKAEIEAIMAADIERYRREGMDTEYQGILEREGKKGRR